MLKLTTDKHEASRGFFATAELLVIDTLAKLLEAHNIKFKMFADDVKVYMSVLNADDAATFQTALNIISDWAQDWQL